MQHHIKIEGIDTERRLLDDLGRNQIPFFIAKNMTAAVDSYKPVIWALLPERFTIRRLAWARAGVRITPATKQHFEAAIEDINKYMELQQTGGEKLAFGRYIAVPLTGARSSLRALIRDQDRPAAVMQQGGFIRASNGHLIMWRVAFKAGRRGRLSRQIGGIQKAADWSRRIVPMYALVSSAQIPRRYGFVEAIAPGIAAKFQELFNAECSQFIERMNR